MSILTDIEFKKIMDETTIVRTKLNNGNIALCLRLKDSACQVILREFRGDHQYRKFVYEAVGYRIFNEFSKKNTTFLTTCFRKFYNFLIEKDKNNNDKIV